jgi:hypothetical protein
MPQEAFDEEQSLLQWLNQYDEEINHLEKQLEILRTERSRLHAHPRPLSRLSIKRVSEDVLVLIFSEAIAESPISVGRLLFVCRGLVPACQKSTHFVVEDQVRNRMKMRGI